MQQLKCKCNKYEPAIQVRTRGGILTLDFYCGNCYTITEVTPNTLLSEAISTLKGCEDRFQVSESEPKKSKVAEHIEAAQGLEEIETEGLTPDEEEDTSATSRDGWTLFGSKAQRKPHSPEARTRGSKHDYSVTLNNICGYFNINPSRLAAILGCSAHSVYCWRRRVNNPLDKFCERIDVLSDLIAKMVPSYGTVRFKRNDKGLLAYLKDNFYNLDMTKVKAFSK